jgi:hypothetical protein
VSKSRYSKRNGFVYFPVAARLRRVPLDDEKQACRELTDILHAVRAIANAVTP